MGRGLRRKVAVGVLAGWLDAGLRVVMRKRRALVVVRRWCEVVARNGTVRMVVGVLVLL